MPVKYRSNAKTDYGVVSILLTAPQCMPDSVIICSLYICPATM